MTKHGYLRNECVACVAVSPIQRAKELVQENQTILNGANSGGSGSSRCVEPMTETTHAECGLNMQSRRSDRGARRGRGRGRGRGHCEPPQIRQPTLLEMVGHHLFYLFPCASIIFSSFWSTFLSPPFGFLSCWPLISATKGTSSFSVCALLSATTSLGWIRRQ